jgi:hypothetical protein
VLWSVTTLAIVFLLGQLVGMVAGMATSIGKTAGQAVVGAAGTAGSQLPKVAQRFGLDAQDALAPVNQRLQAEGKPPVTSEQLQAATGDVLQGAVRGEGINRQQLVSALATNTALSQADAQEVAGRIEAQYASFRQRAGAQISQVGEKVEAGALQAAEVTGKALWGVFAAMLLGLLAAMIGAALAVRRRGELVEGGGGPYYERGTRGRIRTAHHTAPAVAGTAPAQREHWRTELEGSERRTKGRLERMERGFGERLHRLERRFQREEGASGGTVVGRGEEGRERHRGGVFTGRIASAAAGAAAGAGAVAAGKRAFVPRSTVAPEHELQPHEVAHGPGGQEVPRDRWEDLLEALAEQHRDDSVRVEIVGRNRGRQALVDDSPLMGLGMDRAGSDSGAIDIVLGRGHEVFDHRILHPRHLYFREDLGRGSARLAVEDDENNRTLIFFSPRPSEMKRPLH